MPRHIPSHSLGSPNWFSRISKLARALFSIEDANENETIIQRDRASACFSVSPFLFRCPLNATGKAGKRRTRETALNGHHLDTISLTRTVSSLPLPFPRFAQKDVVRYGEAPCAPVLLTRVPRRCCIGYSVVLRFLTSMPCTVHKPSGAREAFECVIEGGMEHSWRLPASCQWPPSEPICQHFLWGWLKRLQYCTLCLPLNVLSCETALPTWNQGRSRICGVHSRRLSGQICACTLIDKL